MKYASKFDQFWHDLEVLTKEYWIEVALLCTAGAILFWLMIVVFNW